MPIANINGANIWYKETGEGPPIVQFHGGGYCHLNFQYATPLLAKHFRVIDFDLRGCGQSDRPLQHYDFDVWSSDAAALMDKLGISKAHVHGTSMGGTIAIHFAANYRRRVDKLVLNACTARLDRSGRIHYQNAIDIVEHIGVNNHTLASFLARQALSREFLDTPGADEAIDRTQEILAANVSPEIYKRFYRALLAADFRPQLRKINASTLVIGGEHDMITPWVAPNGSGMDDLAKNIRDARKHVIRGSNHTTLFENPEEHSKVVTRFLKARKRQARK